MLLAWLKIMFEANNMALLLRFFPKISYTIPSSSEVLLTILHFFIHVTHSSFVLLSSEAIKNNELLADCRTEEYKCSCCVGGFQRTLDNEA